VQRQPVTVLIPGWMHEHAKSMLAQQFRVVEIEEGRLAELTESERLAVRGVASHARIDAHFIDLLPNLEIIANFGVGYEAVDADYAHKKNVVVTNTPDVLTEEVADTTVGLLLNVVRELSKAEQYLRSGKWMAAPYPLTRLTLRDRSIGIYGMGRIGRAIARRLEAFGLPIAYHSRRPVEGIQYPYYETLVDLARAVDTLISIVPGTATTANTINAETLKALGGNGVLINMGRGIVVDERALADALRTGTIAAAGLDVLQSEPNVPYELLSLDNLVLTPHIGSASEHTRTRMAELVANNIISWFETGAAITPVR